MRKGHSIFTSAKTDIECIRHEGGVLEVRFSGERGEAVLALINPCENEFLYQLEGEWHLLANPDHAGKEPRAIMSDEIKVEKRGVAILIKEGK